jgi:hypothetical protein
MIFYRKYNTATHIYVPMVKRGVADYALGADWTPSAGDVKVSKDGGAAANIATLPTAITMGNTAMWDFTVSAAELQAAKTIITVGDSATKAVEDQFIIIETYGNASAELKVDLSDAVRMGLTALPNANAEAAGGLFTRGTGAGQINQNANGQIDVRAVAIANGIIAAASFAANALDAVWSTATRVLTAGTNIVLAKGTGVTGFNDLDAAGVRGAVGLASANLDTQLTEVPAIKAKTDQLAFTASGKVDANVLAVDDDTTVPAKLRRSLTVIHAGAVTGPASTTTLIDSSLTHTTTDQLKGRIVIFEGNVTAGLAEQTTDITAFDPATDQLTMTALTVSPAVGDRYVIL